ncbi:disulfide bond formation protein B [Neisseria sp. Ec49-e6-T10]|uniref:disulfide bond formation protein B n=1 Tax=Neisseria sp. Ec49-e6-T10 TaxID=3140744 RepID=UPI003EBE0BCA
MKNLFKPKNVFWLVTLGAVVAASASFYIQYGLGAKPCPLCIFQRVGVICVGLVSLILALIFTLCPPKKSWKNILANCIASIPAILGGSVSIQHLYIQSLPPEEVPACGPGLNFMMDTMPFTKVLSTVLYGSGECAEVQTFLWVPLPLWSLIFFAGVLLFIWGCWFRIGRK